MQQMLSITRKEIKTYFGSPMALIFVGVFLAATLFTLAVQPGLERHTFGLMTSLKYI